MTRNGLDEPEYTIEEKDLKPFCAMNKLTPYKIKFKCYNDCLQWGCPGHDATMIYHHVNEGFTLDFGDWGILSIDRTRMQIIADFIKKLEE